MGIDLKTAKELYDYGFESRICKRWLRIGVFKLLLRMAPSSGAIASQVTPKDTGIRQ